MYIHTIRKAREFRQPFPPRGREVVLNIVVPSEFYEPSYAISMVRRREVGTPFSPQLLEHLAGITPTREHIWCVCHKEVFIE